MSLFGSIMNEFDEDPFFGPHMRSMRQMNNMMNSLFSDPFGMMGGMGMPALMGSTGMRGSHDSLMPYGFPNMNINRLLGGSLDSLANDGSCHSYVSSSVVKMSTGPDGKPQVYRASASTRSAPGGVRETQRTEQDSVTGTKKMAIGHHIGDRAHIIEREQNVHSGDHEERQDYINIEEDEADTFNREWETRIRRNPNGPAAIGPARHRHAQLALPPATSTSGAAATSTPMPQHRRGRHLSGSTLTSPRMKSSTSKRSTPIAGRSPYSQPGQHNANRRHQRNIKSVSGPPDL